MAFSVTYTDPGALSDRQLLLLLLERLTTTMATADETQLAVAALDTKVDALIAAIAPAIANLQASLAAAQQQVAALQAGDAAAAATLSATVDAAAAEAAKVDAALATVTG